MVLASTRWLFSVPIVSDWIWSDSHSIRSYCQRDAGRIVLQTELISVCRDPGAIADAAKRTTSSVRRLRPSGCSLWSVPSATIHPKTSCATGAWVPQMGGFLRVQELREAQLVRGVIRLKIPAYGGTNSVGAGGGAFEMRYSIWSAT